jgi:hypothetical protein
VALDADLSPERRFAGAKGQGLSTYRELVRSMSVKSKPDGGALPLILERWISGIQSGTAQALDPGSAEFDREVERRIYAVTASLEGMVSGFEFAKAVIAYWRAYQAGDQDRKSHVLKWFRGEYVSRKEAREELGINWIVTDETWYDFLKILALFMVGAGYQGVLVLVDELVNLFKIPHPVTRQNNYEKLLAMYNDTLQGKARHIGFFMSGTPQCLEDRHKGIFSYEALRSRLAEGRFSSAGARDLSAPILRLEPLTPEEMYVLAEKLRDIHAGLFDCPPAFTHEDILCFLEAEYSRAGAGSHITPREMIRDFIELAGVLQQNPQKSAAEVLGEGGFQMAGGGLSEEEEIQSDFAEFEL